MMFCMYCGKQIKDGIKFCSHCGKPVETIPDIIAESESKKLSKGIVAIIIIIILLIIVLASIAFIYLGGMEFLGII